MSAGWSDTGEGLSMAASGSCSNPVGLIGLAPYAGAVLDVGCWKLSGDDDQVADDRDGELAAYSEGALFQVAGVAATKGSEAAATKLSSSVVLVNLNSIYPRRSTTSRGA